MYYVKIQDLDNFAIVAFDEMSPLTERSIEEHRKDFDGFLGENLLQPLASYSASFAIWLADKPGCSIVTPGRKIFTYDINGPALGTPAVPTESIRAHFGATPLPLPSTSAVSNSGISGQGAYSQSGMVVR